MTKNIANFIYDKGAESRLDGVISENLNITRSQALNLIKKNLVKINGILAKKSGILLKNGDKIEVDSIQSPQSVESKSDIKIERIYEDSEILVINKPPYLATHGAPSLREESLVEWLKAHNIRLSNISGELREGIVHRLDKQTSGAMVVAKNNASHAHLSTQLQNKTMGRIYLAIIDLPLRENLSIECNLARNPKNRLKFSKTLKSAGAKHSKSNFSKLILSKDSKKELIMAQLETGRTHQIRAHLESINRHIIGDELYGYKGVSERIMLHSYILYLEHLKRGKMAFSAELFDDMCLYLENNFEMEKVNEILSNIARDYIF